MKLVSMGVGNTGTAGQGILRCFGVDDKLFRDAVEDASIPSGTDTVKLLFLRLDEEKFFLSPAAALVPKRAGEPGMDGKLWSLSAEVTLASAEAVDEAISVESDPGKGEEPLRLLGRLAEDWATFKLCEFRWCSATAEVDFGGSGTG